MLKWLRLRDGGYADSKQGTSFSLKCVYWGDDTFGFHSPPIVIMLSFKRTRVICQPTLTFG